MIRTVPLLERGDAILDSFTEADAFDILRQRRQHHADEIGAVDVDNQTGTSLLLMVANALSFDDDGSYLLWVCRQRGTGTALGAISFARWNRQFGLIDFSLFGDAVQTAIVVDAIRCTVEWAFEAHPELRSIECDREARDELSMRILNDAGMRCVGSYFAMYAAHHRTPVLLDKWETLRQNGRAQQAPRRRSTPRNGT